jgi:hypothetical protein
MPSQFKAPVIEDFAAEDIRAFYDSSVFRVWHLAGKERTYKIAKVQRITSEFRNEIRKRAVLRLLDSKGREVPLPLELNATNRKTIQQLYGNRPQEWVGKLITLYPSQTDMAGQTVDCIRVRPIVPGKAASRSRQPASLPPVAQGPNLGDLAEDTIAALNGPVEDEDEDEPPMGALESDHDADDEVDSALQ